MNNITIADYEDDFQKIMVSGGQGKIVFCGTEMIFNRLLSYLPKGDYLWDIGGTLREEFRGIQTINTEQLVSMPEDIYLLVCFDQKKVFQQICELLMQTEVHAAQVHGQTYKGKRCGGFGDVSIFSFYPNKLITSGEGGMVLTDDEELAERCRRIRNLCFIPERRFVHEELGSNFRMTNMQAAIGYAQLEKIDETIFRKREIGRFYRQHLQKAAGILKQPLVNTEYCDNIYWVYGMVLEDMEMDAKQAMEILKRNGIGTRPFFYPIHKQPVFLKMGLFEREVCPVSEKISEQGFYIPSGLGITEEKMQRVVQVILREFLKS